MLSRLLGIVYILMNRGTVRASELAQRFEVSVRTIYRDVEALSMAGIPVYTRQGKNGGISLTEQFVLDKMLISKEEQIQILAALASLEETGAQQEQDMLQRLGDFFQVEPKNWVSIDFSDWSGRRQELFGQIKQAVLNHQVLEFDYYGQNGRQSRRSVEPVQLLFKEYTWYLRAFCQTRKAMRVFKVLRMKRVEVTLREFVPDEARYQDNGAAKTMNEDGQTVPHFRGAGESGPELGQTAPVSAWEAEADQALEITMEIDAREAYRIYDRFEEEEITVQKDGSFLIRMRCVPDDWIYGLILSFGPSARVTGPPTVREEIVRRLEKMVQWYQTKLECPV